MTRLKIESISLQTSLECIRCIQTGLINGRSAIYCISEIRLAIISMGNSFALVDNNNSNDVLSDRFHYLQEIGEICISPLFDSQQDSIDVQSFASCLDLIPVIIGYIKVLQKHNTFDYNSIDIIESIFLVKWDSKVLLCLSNTICEIYPFLKSNQASELRVIVIISIIIVNFLCINY